jgi:hypothetical protein
MGAAVRNTQPEQVQCDTVHRQLERMQHGALSEVYIDELARFESLQTCAAAAGTCSAAGLQCT